MDRRPSLGRMYLPLALPPAELDNAPAAFLVGQALDLELPEQGFLVIGQDQALAFQRGPRLGEVYSGFGQLGVGQPVHGVLSGSICSTKSHFQDAGISGSTSTEDS